MYGRFNGKCCALVVLVHYVHVLAGAAHVDGRTAPSGDDVAPAAPWSEYQIPTVATAPRRLDEEGLNLQEGNWQWEEIAGAALGVVSSIICVAKILAAREDTKRKKRKKEKEKRKKEKEKNKKKKKKAQKNPAKKKKASDSNGAETANPVHDEETGAFERE